MSKVILTAARELIEQKNYAEARTILLTIKDDPTAAKWLVKLNERLDHTSLPPASVKSVEIQPKPVARNYSIETAPPARWFAQDYEMPPPMPLPPESESVGLARFFRWVWGILLLLSIGWLLLGLVITSSVTNKGLERAENNRNSEVAQAGTLLSGGISLTIFACTGLPFFILFGILYWRNGVAIREVKRHEQTIRAMYEQGRWR